MKILFVNACMRKDESRTLRICKRFMEKYKTLNPDVDFEEVDLTAASLKPMDGEYIENRSRLAEAEDLGNEIFGLARQFSSADKIIIGAPYWDFSFPSMLKIYVEHVSANKIAYQYTDKGLEGLCKAQKLLYITTSGGFLENSDFGTEYFKGLCRLYGIPKFDSIKAEGLDIFGADTEKILEKAFFQAEALAEEW